jgi:hypothetical protein
VQISNQPAVVYPALVQVLVQQVLAALEKVWVYQVLEREPVLA